MIGTSYQGTIWSETYGEITATCGDMVSSVEHKLYSYWCFHSSCNILASCLPCTNSNDRSADKSFCIAILIVMATSYLKKIHKKNVIKLKAFFCGSFRICPAFVDDQWPKISSANRKCIPLRNCHSWFANEIQFSVLKYFYPSLINPATSWHQRKLIWIIKTIVSWFS